MELPEHTSLAILIKGVRAAQAQEQWVVASAGCHCLLDLVTATLSDLCQDELQEAGEAAYLLALSLCQQGEDGLAEHLLARLGCSHRLAPAVLQLPFDKASAADKGCLPDLSLPCVFQDTLSGKVFQQLRAGLDRSAAFWSDHNYFEPQTPFFSYLYDLAVAPNTIIEAAIQELHPLLLQSPYGACLAEATCAEWWAHCREPVEPHQLHFDMREAALRQGLDNYRLEHPVISTVLFLTASGGPTVVLDQDSSAGLADRGWLVQPCPNQLLAFKGNLLHGVVPGRPSNPSATEACLRHVNEKRITLIVAWWGPGIRAEPGVPGQGPCRIAPCLRPMPDSLHTTETAHSPVSGQLQAGPGLRAEPSHMHIHAPQNAPSPHVYEQSSSSESIVSSDTESDSLASSETSESDSCSALELAIKTHVDHEADSYAECGSLAVPESQATSSQLLWLRQCQLPLQQQQAVMCSHQEHQTMPASSIVDITHEVSSSQGGSSSIASFDRKAHCAAGTQRAWHEGPSARVYSPHFITRTSPLQSEIQSFYSPPTVAPVWLPVSDQQDEQQCGQGDTQQVNKQFDQEGNQQDHWQEGLQNAGQTDGHTDGQGEGQHWLQLQENGQPAAKRHKHQRQLVLPLPPLRFCVRSADEISRVYQPSRPAVVLAES